MANQGNSGIHSKFQERLRRIRIFRRKKKKQNNDLFIQDKIAEIRQVIREDSTPRRQRVIVGGNDNEIKKERVVSSVIVDTRKMEKQRVYKKKKTGINSREIFLKKEDKKDIDSNLSQKKINVDREKDTKDFSSIHAKGIDSSRGAKDFRTAKVQRDKKKKIGYDYSNLRGKFVSDDKEEAVTELGTQIIEKIKESFEDKLDELEVLESELYFLKKDQENEVETKKVIEIKKRIHDIINKINDLIDQYNLYNRNYYLDHVIGIDDSVIVDDIIDYRDLLDSFEDERKFVREYKLLDEFQSLYRNLKTVRDDTERLVLENEQKIHEFDIRDKKYHDVQLGVVHASEVDQKCSLELERQNVYFTDLMKKISKINQEEYTTYHLRGIGELVSQSLRYMGFLMLSPLSGLLPGIAVHTLATRRMIGNIYRNMKVEEVNHVHYEAVNYDSELNHHLCDVDYTSCMIEDTLKDIERLKEEFMMQYDYRIPGYEDTLKKITMIEKKVLHNQNKVDIIKKNLKRSKKINEDKLEKVRKLNENHFSE